VTRRDRAPQRVQRRRMPMFGDDDRRIDTRTVILDTADAHRWDAMLFRPRDADPARRRVAVMVVHGSVGNYLTGVPRRLAFGIAEAGWSTLAINTRMANYGPFFGGGLLDRTPLDLDAGIHALRNRGYTRIVLLGFSMGATMVTSYQAIREPDDVVGVATLAHPLSLPQSLRRRWDRFGAEPGYGEMTNLAWRALGRHDSPENDRIVVVRRAKGPTDHPEHCEIWTYRTWWHARGPEALNAESRRWIGILRVPLAIIQGGADPLIPVTEGEELARLARAGGCPDVHLEYIDGADHVFTGCEGPAVAAMVGWIERTVNAHSSAASTSVI
jgi:alpha-beta hydrolase superfamily lysophospholipase